MTERGPVVTESDVAAFEAAAGYRLPDAYRSFLLAVNGGRLSEECREFSGPAASFVVNNLYSLNDPDESFCLDPKHTYTADVPSADLLSIGYDDAGNLILLGIRGPHAGEVWFQDRINGRPEGANPRVLWHDRRDMRKLADNFDEFIARLGPLT